MLKKIVKIINLFKVLSLIIFISFSFANVDSTRVTGIDKFDVDYLPAGNKCGYSIGFVLGWHEGYLRKYVSLIPVQVDVDSIIDQVNISTFGCSYDIWKSYLDSSTKICQDQYLKEPFIPSLNLGVYDSGVFLKLIISGNNVISSGNVVFCLSGCKISLQNINDIVTNKLEVNSEFPINISLGGEIKFYKTGFVILESGGTNTTFNWQNVDLYPNDYYPIEYSINVVVYDKQINVTYKYLNYKLEGSVTYDLRKLYNYSSFRNLWHGLYKIGDKLVIKPIGGKNYIKFKSVYFSGTQVITQGAGEVHDVSEYDNNLCKNEHYVGSWWWVSRNDTNGITPFAQDLGMSPDSHEKHQCASTWLVIKNPYFNGKRVDRLDVDSITIGINSLGNINRTESVSSCDTEVLNWQKPKDASIDINSLNLKIDGYTAYKDNVNKEFVIYATNNNVVCFDNIKIDSVPVDFSGSANHVQAVYRKITAVQMVVRPYGSTNNIGESNKHVLSIPIDKDDVPTVLNNVCFNIDWYLNGGKNAFEKVGKYWFLLKFWSDDEIRGSTPLMTIKVIPNNNYNFKQFNYSFSSPCKADGKCKLVINGIVTDNFGNNIDLTISDGINNVVDFYGFSTGIVDINETTNSYEKGLFNKVSENTFQSDGYFKLIYIPYNKKVINTNPNFVIKLRKRNLDGTLQNYFVNLYKNVNIFNIDGIFLVELTGLSQNFPFNTDIVFKLKLKNLGNSDVGNLKIHYIPKFTSNGIDVSNKILLVPATGDVNLIKLLNGSYNINDLAPGKVKEILFTGRLELKGEIINPKTKIGGKILLDFMLNGGVGNKEVKAYYSVNSNLTASYRGVYVEGLYSNTAKGLYELLRASSSSMAKSSYNTEMKNKFYNMIIRNVVKLTKAGNICSDNMSNISGICKRVGSDVVLNGGKVIGKSLIYVEGGNVIIKGNIKKSSPSSLLTIVVRSDSSGKGGYVFIDNNVTNIDAIIVTEKGIFPLNAKNNIYNYMIKVVRGLKNNELKNQLVIYGMVISRGNTIGGSIKINGRYILPGGKQVPGTNYWFYRSAIYDLNYLRRYHKVFNPGNPACDPKKTNSYSSSCIKLDSGKYGTFPVVIIYDPAIKIYKAYGF